MGGKKLFKATFILMIVTIISKGIGFFRDVLVASNFGVSSITDAYDAAVAVPDTIYAIIGLAISTTFIPALSKSFHKDGNKGMYNLANNIISILTVISIVIFILGFIFTDKIVYIMAPGMNEQSMELTIFLTRITLVNIVLLPINSCFSAILQYKEDFVIPGILGLFFNIPIILYLVVANPKTVVGLAIANVVGNIFRVVVQIPSLYKHGYKFKFFINLRDERIKTIMLLLVPVIIGAGANALNMIVDKNIGSIVGEGSIAALGFAQKIVVLINSVFTMSILTVVYPIMSKKLHEHDMNSFLDYLCKAMRLAAIMLLPIMSGMIVYRTELIDIFFGRGEFDETAILLTSMALIGYAIQLPFLGIRDMLNSSFFSMEKTMITSVNSIVGVIVNIILSISLSKVIGISGISIASAISAIITSALLFNSLKNMSNEFDIKPTINEILKMSIATLVMTIFIVILNRFTANMLPLVRIIIGSSSGAIIYFIVAKILKVSEFEDIVEILLRKKATIE